MGGKAEMTVGSAGLEARATGAHDAKSTGGRDRRRYGAGAFRATPGWQADAPGPLFKRTPAGQAWQVGDLPHFGYRARVFRSWVS
jgi:hypothetical protein